MIKDLIIIGGGAAGCSAGIYSARKKLDTILIAKDFMGQTGISSRIENYLGFGKINGHELAQKFQKHVKDFNIDVRSYEEVMRIDKIDEGFDVTTDEGKYQARAIIIATGSIPKKLNATNEDTFIGKGISYCVTCDETAFEGKTVAVIGAGNAGLESAIELTRFASKVFVLEYLDKSIADAVLLDEAQGKSQIEIIYSAQVKAFTGDCVLQKIVYEDRITHQEKEIIVDGCFIEIGYQANTEFCADLVRRNTRGEIEVNPRNLETSTAGVFSAGDVNDFTDKQIILAAGQGALAALSAYRYLK